MRRLLYVLLIFVVHISFAQKQLSPLEKIAGLGLIPSNVADSLEHSQKDKGFLPHSSLFSHPNTVHLSGVFEAIGDWHYLKQNKVVLTRINHTPSHYGKQHHLKKAEFDDFAKLLQIPRKPGRPEVTHYSESGFSSTTLDSLNQKYMYVLQELEDLEVISEFVKDSTINSIKKTHVYALSQLFDRLSEVQKFTEDYHVKRERQLRFVHALEYVKVLKKGTEPQIEKQLIDYRFIELFHLLPFCNNSIIVDLEKLPDTPEEYYPSIINQIATIVPDFDPVSIKATLLEKSSNQLGPYKEVSLQFKAKKINYRQPCGYHTHSHEDPAWKYSGRMDPSFIDVVNRYLESTSSKKRICFLQASHPTTYSNYQKFAILCLDQKQYNEWKKYESYFEFAQPRLNRVEWTPRLSPTKRSELIARFKEQGLIDSKDKKTSSQLTTQDYSSNGDFIFALKDLSLEWPPACGKGSCYKKLLKSLAKKAQVSIKAVKLSDKNNPKSISFIINGKSVSCDLEVHLDPDLLKIVNEALSDSGKRAYFFDSDRGVAILTPKQEKFLFDYLDIDFE